MKIPRDLSGEDVVKALQRLGFSTARQRGSHVRLVKDKNRITVPMQRSIAVGTLQSILRQAGLELQQFIDSLK
jgi:predicted RNA binding protein YcfA (HicA-like mRNA interferase family)